MLSNFFSSSIGCFGIGLCNFQKFKNSLPLFNSGEASKKYEKKLLIYNLNKYYRVRTNQISIYKF